MDQPKFSLGQAHCVLTRTPLPGFVFTKSVELLNSTCQQSLVVCAFD